jgi:hypothetical protein
VAFSIAFPIDVINEAIAGKSGGNHYGNGNLERPLYRGAEGLYSAENQIIKALPKMIKAASHSELKQAFTTQSERNRDSRTENRAGV